MLISLTTDYGLGGGYVAAMKGVIYTIFPEACVLDISHEISPQGIFQGAFVLASTVPYLPDQSIHIVVVDPGVGGARKPLLIRTERSFFVGPDNGVFTMVLRQEKPLEIVELTETKHFRLPVSHTFHGRDIFAPVGAHLARTLAAGQRVNLQEFGPPMEEIKQVWIPSPTVHDGSISGQVIHVDRFGNLITNLDQKFLAETVGERGCRITMGQVTMHGLVRTYGEGRPNEAVALIGSSGYLEIAVNAGSARHVLKADVGEPVEIEVVTS